MEFIWIDEAVAQAIHDAQLAEHGGLAGVRRFLPICRRHRDLNQRRRATNFRAGTVKLMDARVSMKLCAT